ncbi:protein DEK-like isoform X2 [Anthonomus grandis grandis]|uniref:protein DEK-like isoform X2 n=1 Tax=Anthonomus grandis grandis TaxID=2921223 RepID=UPI002165647A|nr:protein DEK-like isoform X2 [Anthonomus grandis grandis]
MTFAMSTEGDSVKSALSEANDKSAAENHTDESSQDSMDAKEEPDPKKPAENNVNSADKDEKALEESTEGEGESEHESETSEKKEDGENAEKKGGSKEENDTKNKKEDSEVKEEDKEAKSEEGDNKSAEEEEVKKTDDKPEKAVKKEKPKKEKKASKEKEEKSSNASEKDDEEEEDQEEEEEEEVEEQEEEEEENKKGKKKKGVPLLDQPLETSGKRERKNVQRYDEPEAKKEPGKIEFEEGKGTKLGEIPRVEAAISRSRGDDLKFLHKFLFDQPGQKLTYKKNIRLFCGFGFENDSDEFKTKQENLKKQDMKSLKIMCEILDLGKTGNKDEISDRILEFLMEPKDSGKPVGTGRPKRASAVRANNRGLIQSLSLGYSSHDDYSSDEKQTSRARRDKGKRSNLKDDSSSDEEFKPPGESDASDEKPRSASKRKRGRPKKQGGSSEEDEVSISGASSDESEDAPSSKRRKSVTKNSRGRAAKTPSKKGRPARAAATPRSAKGKRGRKAKDVSSEEEEEEEEKAGNEGSSSEDEPLVKKKKGSEPPTDDEIKSFIKSVLEGANLEEITMKTVCQRVYDNYPDFDLTARKNFIKSTVKSLIST